MIKIIKADITTVVADAIVNAANETLLGGSGVDGAIHRVAGPELLRKCRTLGGCKTGEAKLTDGYCLPAKYIIHTVGPVWRIPDKRGTIPIGDLTEDRLLAACYRNCLLVAMRHAVKSIAFPAISTGAYGFPVKRAAAIAIGETRRFLDNHTVKVLFICHSTEVYDAYQEIMNTISDAGSQQFS